jgi:hypothetical protein
MNGGLDRADHHEAFGFAIRTIEIGRERIADLLEVTRKRRLLPHVQLLDREAGTQYFQSPTSAYRDSLATSVSLRLKIALRCAILLAFGAKSIGRKAGMWSGIPDADHDTAATFGSGNWLVVLVQLRPVV